ncbi:MAG: hypothetical protein CMI30_08475 [Opitutae bacterium]|nr:hypothetical protein [Opitutae bacterium]|tara:strand:- start:376 stop:1653 length:1278 start_codon:yes stop_codon:yes gene_type:complete
MENLSKEQPRIVTYLNGEKVETEVFHPMDELDPRTFEGYSLVQSDPELQLPDSPDFDDFSDFCDLFPVDVQKIPCGWFLNGEKATEDCYRNEIRDGEWILFSMGRLVRRGRYVQGEREGFWEFFNPQDIRSIDNSHYLCGHFKRGKKEGLWNYFTVSNRGSVLFGKWSSWNKREEASYKDGEKDGPYIKWFENGQEESKGKYEAGEKEGIWTSWHEDGQMKEKGTYKGGEKEGVWTKWHKNGQQAEELHYLVGKREGPFIKMFEQEGFDAQLISLKGRLETHGNYKADKKDGVWVFWHSNGQKKEKGHYKEGNKDGVWVTWFCDGQMEKEIDYKEGSGEPMYQCFTDHWGHTWKGHYKNGKQNGPWSKWHFDGKKIWDGHYKDGKKDGVWILWHPGGLKSEVFDYRNGPPPRDTWPHGVDCPSPP